MLRAARPDTRTPEQIAADTQARKHDYPIGGMLLTYQGEGHAALANSRTGARTRPTFVAGSVSDYSAGPYGGGEY